MILDAGALSLFGMKFSPLRFSEFFSLGTLETSFHSSDNTYSIVAIAIIIITSYVVFRWSIDFSQSKLRKAIVAIIICTILSYASGQTLSALSWPSMGQLFLSPLFVTINDMRQYNISTKGNTTRSWSSMSGMQWYYDLLDGYDRKHNVIILFAESFSPEYSKRNGGLSDSMPQFDRIQEDGLTLTNYMAPGCVSEHAHTSLLQWIFPLRYGDLFTSDGYEAFSADHEPLATFFDKQWYETTFISAVPLTFLHQEDFIKKVGYQTIINENAFSGSAKYIFDAAPDADLYTKTIDVVKQYQWWVRPFFITLQSISSHLWRQTPYGNSKEDAIRYADDSIGVLYDQLRQTKFFDNGILIILSDHRIPGNPDASVTDALWPTRPSRVVATIVGTGVAANSFNDTVIQPIDFHFGLKQLISDGALSWLSFINNPFDSFVRRDRWLYYCKYKDNTIWTIHNNMLIPLEHSEQKIQDFVTDYQWYQFHRNIVNKKDTITSGTVYSWTHIPRKDKKFLLFGHGGAPAYAPYNSLSGMLLALAQWADGIELDLSYTKDNVNIVSHGPFPQLQRDKGDPEKHCYTRNKIADTDFKTIWKQCPLPNGEKMMNFDEFIRLTRDVIPLYMVELKVYDTTKWIQQMYDALAIAKKYGVTDKIIRVSYDPVVRKLLTMQEWIIPGRDMFDIAEYGGKLFDDFSYSLMPFQELMKAEILTQLKQFGKPIISYTPLTSGDIATVYNLGIDGMLVDDIPLAKQTIAEIEKETK